MNTVAAGAAIISAGMLLSRILGYVRERMLIHVFGGSDISGAYNLAFVVPDLFYNLLAGGALSAAFIPVFTRYITNKQDRDAHRVGSTFILLLIIVMSVCATLGIIFAPQLINLLQLLHTEHTRLNAESIALTISLTRTMCFMLIFTALSGLFTGILNSYKHFLTPVIIWLVYNLSIMVGIGVFSKLPIFGGSPAHPNIHGAAYGVVIGAFLMAAIQFPVTLRHGFRFHPAIDLRHEGVRKVLILFAPVMLGLAMSQINLMILPLIIGSKFGLPAVTDIRMANRLVLLPLGLFAIAISTAAFPQLAEQIARGQLAAFRETMQRSMKAILLLSIPSAVGLFVLAEPITYLLWGGGKFDATSVRASAFVLMFFAWGLLGLGLTQVVSRAFYSMHDMVTPVIVGISMVVVNIPLSLYFAQHSSLQYGSVALATTLTTTLSTLVLLEILRRRMNGFGGRSILWTTEKITIASCLMGVVLYVVANFLAPTFLGERLVPVFRWPAPALPFSVDPATLPDVKVPQVPLLIQVGASMVAGIIIYFAALWVMRVEELHLVTSRIMSKLRKRPAAV